jgi:hypothetical protein
MPTVVATYYQLQDDEIEVSGGKVTFRQSVGVTPAGGEGALVTWVAREGTGAANVTYTVTLNNFPLNIYTLTSTERITIQEATDTNNVIRGDNQLVFEVTSNTGGTLVVGDVMLWHRVSVD